MSVVHRSFGRPPSAAQVLPRAKEFTDMAMEIPLDDIFQAAKFKRKIGRSAADIAAKRLRLEGDGDSKRVVFVAYDYFYDMMAPTLDEAGPDHAAELFKKDASRQTVSDLSRDLSSYGLSQVAFQYANQGSFLEMTHDGLVLQKNAKIPTEYEAQAGCPYVRGKLMPYFNRFAGHTIETFAEASRQEMPHSRTDAIKHVFRR